MIRSLAILALATAAVVPAPSEAQRCGDTIHRSTRLSSDIVCPVNAPFGLRIAAPNVQLDLNGHSIVVPTNHPQTPWGPVCIQQSVGIDVIAADNVVIHDGRIEVVSNCPDFGVRFTASDRGVIHGVSVSFPRAAVSIEGSKDVVVSGNEFNSVYGVLVSRGSPQLKRTSERIVIRANTMPPSQRPRVALVTFAPGAAASGSRVLGNDVDGTYSLADVGEGNDNIQIIGNIQRNAPNGWSGNFRHSIAISGNMATISDNWIEGNAVAIGLAGDQHVVERNYLSAYSVVVALGIYAPSYPASRSVIRDNMMTIRTGGGPSGWPAVSDTGIWFGPHASSNDGRGNQFHWVSKPVIDDGTGNVY